MAILEDRSVALPCSLPGKGVKFEVCESEFLERQVDERHGAGRMRGVERDLQDHFLSRRGADDRGKVHVPCSGTPSPVPGVQAPAPVRGHPQASGRSPRAAIRVSDSVSSLLKRALDKVRLLQRHMCTAVKGNAVSTRKRCPFSPHLSLPCGFLGKDSGRGRQRGRPCWGGGLAAGVRGQGSGLDL